MKRISVFLIAVVLVSGILGCSDGSHPDGYPDIREDAVLAVDQPIGSIDVEYWERVVDGVFHVINDYVLIRMDPDTGEIIECEEQWRDIDVDLANLEVEPFEPPGGEYFWKRVVVLLEQADTGYFYTVSNSTQYPLVCWETRYSDGTTEMCDLDGNEIGYGIPTPFDSYSLSGYEHRDPTHPDWPDSWRVFRENALNWFARWSDMALSQPLAPPASISFFVSDPYVQLYYALAHGNSNRFQADSVGSYYRASNAEDDMEDRDPMLFAFIGHCEGMSQTGTGSFSHVFRKGSMTNTVTVGYSGMAGSQGWPDALDWQDDMFERMDEGRTVRDAFDLACQQFPLIAGNVVFVGDTNLRIPIAEDNVVSFPDANLEAAIREAIGKPTGAIYQSDLERLTLLGAFDRDIGDITGLEYCTSLTDLCLSRNQIDDISELVNLTNLTILGLHSNQIDDISDLANLTNLRTLHLETNQINDISPLEGLTKLTHLVLAYNQINDISPLSNLTDLTELSLGSNPIDDISDLANLTNLTNLELHNNQITNVAPLAGLTGLTYLSLYDNQIDDISELANLTNLTSLGLGKNQISDISHLSSLTNLDSLFLQENQISDIEPLVDNLGLADGDYVDLQFNPLSDDSINIYIPQLEARGVEVIY